MKDILIINSYAGSLVLGAQSTGTAIRRSMEDSGYGIAAQRLNFPELAYCDHLPWPAEDLSETAVIAHPPCAAFSNMNLIKDKRGLGTDAFECHRRVMLHAFKYNAAALAIESVTGALKAAASEYAKFAEMGGYNHCFILLNAIGFGVPQWRPRFWAIFFRKDLKFLFFKAHYEPRYVNIQSILTGDEARDESILKRKVYHQKRFTKAGFNFEEMMRGERLGGFDSLAKDFLGEEDSAKLKALTGTLGCYRAGLPRKLDPTLWAPVILGFSSWYVHDRPLNRVEYQRIMGFPDNFKWPDKMRKDFLTYLSKGVCPPVAHWILNQLIYQEVTGPTHSCNWGEVLDLQPQKKAVEAILRRENVL